MRHSEAQRQTATSSTVSEWPLAGWQAANGDGSAAEAAVDMAANIGIDSSYRHRLYQKPAGRLVRFEEATVPVGEQADYGYKNIRFESRTQHKVSARMMIFVI